jgi:Na+/H+ antiporter NhaC
MEGTIFSIIPPVLMLVLVLLTRRILVSLGAGIIVGALFIHDFHILDTIKEIGLVFSEIFISDGVLNVGDILLLLFLVLLGMMTAFLQASGGSRAFGEWMMNRIKTRRGSQMMTGILGIIIFIDDYFTSLAVGQIARPVTDRQRISRVKLAYLIDSTSAPVTVISPISSWGAYIIGILGSLFATYGITSLTPLEAFIKMIPYNFYALFAILLVFLTAWLHLDIGPMRQHEERAIKKGQVLDPKQKNIPGDLGDELGAHNKGKIYHLLLPIVVLFIVTIVSMILTGAAATEEGMDLFSVFANTNVNLSLFLGGLSAVLVSLLFHLGQSKPRENTVKIIKEGTKTMLPAIYILILAWMVGSIIGKLETGSYLAELVERFSINPSFLPILFFIIAGLMALSTGTSWATFGMMLPIALEVTIISSPDLLLASLAAVLAGAVFGDHCSPISDTTVLSSTGAGSNMVEHVITQLPYALLAAAAAIIGYFVIAVTHQLWIALFISFVFLVGGTLFIKALIQLKTSQDP